MGGEVGSDEPRFSGYRAAQGREMGEVRLLGPAWVLRNARLDQSGDLVGDRVGHRHGAGNCTKWNSTVGD
jgi:hypothetical protein